MKVSKILALAAAAVAVIVLIAGSVYLYECCIDYRFATVSEGRVYRSAAMPMDLLAERVRRYGIRAVVDLRTVDATPDEERAALAVAGARYFYVPSGQIPSREVVAEFLRIMDDDANYPALVHCTHGAGRAPLFAAIYRIEYEGWTPEEARRHARWFADIGTFSRSGRKGRFLLDYVPRAASEPQEDRQLPEAPHDSAEPPEQSPR